MQIEHTANVLTNRETINLLQNLVEQEQIILSEKRLGRSGDRDRRKKAERQAKKVRRSLVQKHDPTIIYLYLKATELADSDEFRTVWQEEFNRTKVEQRLSIENDDFLPLEPPTFSVKQYPPGSFSLQIPFRLQRPYISRDDQDFYIIDNPIQREKVFRAPMVRSTSWKGALRSAIWKLGYKELNPITIRLFGTANDEDESGKAGRLHFFNSYFSETDLEIINPQDRKTKTGKNPILLEVVPSKDISTLNIFYVPFDRVGENEIETCAQALKDLVIVSKGIQAMFTGYGFGAKTSSGFGVTHTKLPDIAKFQFRLENKIIHQSDFQISIERFDRLVAIAEALERTYLNGKEG